MKNQKGFIVPVLIAVIALLAIGGGVYVYKDKKAEAPVDDNGTQQTDTTQLSITVVSPNGGETYKAGGQMTVKWQTKNVDSSSSNVWIHLDTVDGRHLDNGDLVSTHIQNNGEKTVTIPANIPAGQYKVAVTVAQAFEDTSNNYFSITSSTTSPILSQSQAQTLVLQTWGGCTPDTCGSVNVTVQNNNGQYTVTAIYEGLRDDSSSAQKKVAPAYYSNGVWTLGTATVTQRCQPGRGHQDFSSALCI